MDLVGQSVAVLVVEDEPLIRMSVAATIEDAGFKVYEAANADEALGLLAECVDIRVLFTDVDMPGAMDGVALAHYAYAYRPIEIIVTSGHRKIAVKDLPPKAIFMEKPYRPGHVVETLREIAA
jgi:two-component system, response regulator PdtaR